MRGWSSTNRSKPLFRKAAGECLLHAPRRHRIGPFFAQHVLAEEITRFSDVEGELGAVLEEFAQPYPPCLQQEHPVGGISLRENRLAGGIDLLDCRSYQGL